MESKGKYLRNPLVLDINFSAYRIYEWDILVGTEVEDFVGENGIM
jgi:hypothetical protein